MFDTAEAQAYLTRRFGEREGYVAMAFKIGGVDSSAIHKEIQFQWPSGSSTLIKGVQWMLNDNPQTNVYVCPTLRSSSGKRTELNELQGHTVFADLDGGRVVDDLLPWCELVNSGSPEHYHLYIPLSDPVSLDRMQLINYAAKQAFNGDHKWVENTILRLPGTPNTKNGRMVTTEKLADKTIKAETLETYLKKFMPNSSILKAQQAPDFQWTEVKDLKPYLQKLLDETPVVGKRSDQAYHFINTCFEHGLNYHQVCSLAHKHEPTKEKFIGKRIQWVVWNIMNKRLGFIENVSTWLPQKKS